MLSEESNPWFVCPQPRPGAETRLFLFPYAGGGPASFGRWSVELPGTIETWIAHYPGRGSRHNEPPIKDLVTLANRLAQAIRPLLDKPVALFGHSFGGLVTFELARQLQKLDVPQPQLLFISACGAPHIPDSHPPIHALPDAELLKSLQSLNGIPAEMARFPELLELTFPILRADIEAFEGYRYDSNGPALNCPIITFGGLEDARVSREHLEGWAQHSQAGFRSQYFPGDHFFINTARRAVLASISAELVHPMQKTESKTNWSHPPDVLELQPDQADVWRIHLDLPVDTVKALESTLSADEAQRAARFHFPAARQRYIAAHGCLRDILARYLACEPGRLSFSTNQYGKPALQDHNLEFNLSHSGDFALLAVTQNRKVGIDVERIRSEMEVERIANRFFSQNEVSELMALPPDGRQIAFFDCWARKEAYIKAQGFGLSLPLDSFDVSLNEPALLRATRPNSGEAALWKLLSLGVDPGYAAALAVDGTVLQPEGVSKGAAVSWSKDKNLDFRFWDWNVNHTFVTPPNETNKVSKVL